MHKYACVRIDYILSLSLSSSKGICLLTYEVEIFGKTQWLISLKKEENPTICSNMDKPGRDYAKWNKSVTKGQILYDSS